MTRGEDEHPSPEKPERGLALARLLSSGRVIPAQLDLAELGPPPERPHETSASEALAEQRRER